jgi:hypothetical protein
MTREAHTVNPIRCQGRWRQADLTAGSSGLRLLRLSLTILMTGSECATPITGYWK